LRRFEAGVGVGITDWYETAVETVVGIEAAVSAAVGVFVTAAAALADIVAAVGAVAATLQTWLEGDVLRPAPPLVVLNTNPSKRAASLDDTAYFLLPLDRQEKPGLSADEATAAAEAMAGAPSENRP
jgi:hypothetical protein